MALEVVYGESRDRSTAQRLAELLRPVVREGTIYLAYPVLNTADERVEIDALLVSKDHGLVAFLLADEMPATTADWSRFVETQDRLYAAIDTNLRRHDGLRQGRRLVVEPVTATLFPSPVQPPADVDGYFGELEAVADFVSQQPPIDDNIKRNLEAALQRVSTIKPAKRRAGVATTTSRGAKMKEIEKGIANLDRWQKAAAIESADGPQRIRGLAGSGKTVVLSLKAAYWHVQHPEWNIVLTFASRALYQQIDDLVTRFTFEHSNDQPDYAKLRILHSWGSQTRVGVYALMARALGEPVRDFAYARAQYGGDDPFGGICRELLAVAQTRVVQPIFHAVLIDEAQDLPPEFFQLLYLFTHEPKRIVWGYDELQKLSEAAMPTTQELFGVDADGATRVSLDGPADGPRRDIVLPVCYRNTPWALATAHALGTGIYRKPDGLIQHPDEPKLWSDIGYQIVSGELELGSPVTLARRPDASPSYFDNLLVAEDSVMINTFSSESQQDRWVADQIWKNLNEDELEPDDILIVLPDSYTSKTRGNQIMRALSRLRIRSHLVGVTNSRDAVFAPDSVAIAHIYRAKGNEAPMVYVMDAQYADKERNLVTRRNILFTAITRSRAWVRIVGWGPGVERLLAETKQVIENGYRLKFTIPTGAELKELRHIYRDRTAEHEENIRRATEGLSAFLDAFSRGELSFRDIPPELRTQLTQSFSVQPPSDQEDLGGE
ncbi:DEAD/DEAH box helicase [Nocardia cyriacigeorgica]|uniref:DEAD/DEAH box helicase n=1 Tax=Nocardia cyriacigeorgica TaxID=135487 RepID=UPI0024927236|nr:ATP-binding domain-containing protein [Nocardia cyriacigeorgica]BDU04602.1 hypothetical protein FMUBM48_08650 [Nocardia cyriacigeorgica]